MAWVSAGVLANAALITVIGFILSCTLCFMLAVRGLRLSEGKAGRRPARTAARLRHRLPDRGAGVLAVHQAAGDQPAGPHRHGWL
jgi:hypothetical protein